MWLYLCEFYTGQSRKSCSCLEMFLHYFEWILAQKNLQCWLVTHLHKTKQKSLLKATCILENENILDYPQKLLTMSCTVSRCICPLFFLCEKYVTVTLKWQPEVFLACVQCIWVFRANSWKTTRICRWHIYGWEKQWWHWDQLIRSSHTSKSSALK